MGNTAIKHFINGIESGPFTELKNGGSINDVIKKEGHEKDIFYCAVYQGYLDMCRTLSYSNKKHEKEKVFDGLEELSNEITKYFNGNRPTNKDDFDEKYESFLDAFSDSGITIGQKQKVINMTFKYLYCCNETRNEYKGYFKYCHMPLDSFTINWYNNTGDTGDDKITEKWSNINDIELYKKIVSNIRTRCNAEKVLMKEFDIWENEKLLDILLSLKSSVEGIEKSRFRSDFSVLNVETCEDFIERVKKDLGYKNNK